MPKLTQNFNISPYFDDFSEDNEFYRVLFRPGFSVQARELNQIQSIIHNQIEKLGDINFQNGSRVFGGELTLNTKINSLTVKVEYLGEEIDVNNFIGRTIQGQTSLAKAEVVAASLYTNQDNNTLMINYFGQTLFLDGEVINTIDDGVSYFAVVTDLNDGIANAETLITNNSSKNGSVVGINEGIFYLGGYFLFVPTQNIILDKFSSFPTYRIGLEIDERIINSVQDTSLLDNALGYPNLSAPGANRYKITLDLVKKDFFEKGKQVIPSGTAFTIDEKDYKSGTISVTTAVDHNLNVGDTVVVSGALENVVNGKHVISSIGSSTTFSYKILGKPQFSQIAGDVEYIKGIVDPIEKNSDPGFIELLRVENGEKTEEIFYPIIGDIEKTLARRTYDTSGDFFVRPFSIDITEHKISGIASPRSAANTLEGVFGSGTNFVDDLNQGDVIFFSGNTQKTSIVETIQNTTFLVVQAGGSFNSSLGNGSDFQRIGVEDRFTLEIGPGKAYVKGFEFETITTKYLDLKKARDTRTVTAEQQVLNFGPYIRVTDLFANNVIDTGVDTASGGGSGMDIIDLHMVKWPSTDKTDGTANLISSSADTDISFVGINLLSTDDINRTKIGTARIRQLDYFGGRSSSVDSKYATDVVSTSDRSYHRTFPAIFDAHLFDFRFNKISGTAGANNDDPTIITLDNYFPTPNCLYGATITVNTSFLGVVTTDTRRIISYTGTSTSGTPSTTYTAVLDTPLTQPTRTDSTTYSINFSLKDVRSGIKIKSPGGGVSFITAAFNVDVSGKSTLTDEGDTILFDNNDDQRTLLFPLNNKAIASTSDRKYKFKRTYDTRLNGNTATISTIFGTNEKFYPGTASDLTLSESQAEQNYVVTVYEPVDGNQTGREGDYVEFSNSSGSGLSSGRSIRTELGGQRLVIDVGTDHPASTKYDYSDKYVHVVATMMSDDATVGSDIGKKTLISGNTSGAVVDSRSSVFTPQLTQAQQGQLAFGTELDYSPGAINSLKISDIKNIVAIVDSRSPIQNVSNVMVSSAISAQQQGTFSAYDVTDNFIFNNGQKDNYYDYGTITLKNGAPKPLGQILIVLNYYTHQGFGPFTVDSYTYQGTGNTPYGQIPSHTSPVTGKTFLLRDVIDFRPKRVGIETDNGGGSSNVNNILTTSNVFSQKCMPDYDFEFECDYDHYLPRKDKIVLNRDRSFKVIQGISDLNPVLPPDDDESITLYTLELQPYTTQVSDIKIGYVDNKRYTMRDIGKLEKRIESLEYYVTLSLIEKEADSLVITDSNNNDRFKNGILVDAFQGHNIGDVLNLDYKCSIDFKDKKLRPSFYSDSHKFDIDSENTTLVNNSGIITLPFSKSLLVSQPFTASYDGVNTKKIEKIMPSGAIQNYIGAVFLDPQSDTWYDVDSRVSVKVNIEGQFDNWQKINYRFGHGSQWKDWEEFWSGKQINDEVKLGLNEGESTINERSTPLTNQQKTVTGITTGNIPEQIIKTFGNKVLNISIVPAIREQKVTFVAKGLQPNDVADDPRNYHYAFFGDTRVTHFIKQASVITLNNVNTANVFRTTPGNFETIRISGSVAEAGNTATVVYMTNRNSLNSCSIMVTNMSNEESFRVGQTIIGNDTNCSGTIDNIVNYDITDNQLTVNQDGVTAGEFFIPKSLFKNSDTMFKIVDNIDDIPTLTTSVAESTFYSKGIIDNKIENGIVSPRPIIRRRNNISSELVNADVLDSNENGSANFYYPLAQTFFVDNDLYPKGVFLESVVLFFNKKDNTVGAKPPVTLQLRPMINGKPSPSIIIPGSEVILTSGQITANTSIPVASTTTGQFPALERGNTNTANERGLDIGSKTIFKFDYPVYVTSGEYAIVLLTNSTSYELYGFDQGAFLTGTNIANNLTAKKLNYVGNLFKPVNSGSYSPQQDRGLMFEVYRCEFTETSGYTNFVNRQTSLNANTSNTVFDSFKLMSDGLEFANTFVDFKHSFTDRDQTTRNSEFRFSANKTVELQKQKQISYITNTSDDQYSNSLMINLYFETANTLISPVIDKSRLSLITVENLINNGELTNSSIIITNNGTGYDTDINGNTSVFVVSLPDYGTDRATLAANVHANSSVNQVYIVNPGSGYVTTPTVTVYDGGVAGDDSSNVASTVSMEIKINGEGAKASEMLSANKEHSFGGNLLSRYISKRVTLEEGFDAKDLRIYLDVYRPRGTNIHVYYKVLADGDQENFDEKPYVAMVQETASSTFSLNEDDTKEFVFKTFDQYISYTNQDGTVFDNFRTFAIKIAFTVNRASQTNFIGIPKVLNMKAIALDSAGVA